MAGEIFVANVCTLEGNLILRMLSGKTLTPKRKAIFFFTLRPILWLIQFSSFQEENDLIRFFCPFSAPKENRSYTGDFNAISHPVIEGLVRYYGISEKPATGAKLFARKFLLSFLTYEGIHVWLDYIYIPPSP